LSNFTDFAALERASGLHVYYTDDPAELASATVIILPGTKNTIGDLLVLRELGVDKAVIAAAEAGVAVIGICGGYQMMGLTVADPYGVEGEAQTVSGLGLLPVHTVLSREKTTVRRRFRFGDEQGPLCEGYEIHMGQTVADGAAMPSGKAGPPVNFPVGPGESVDGYKLSNHCWGTYMHGILDNQPVVKQLLGVDIPDYRAFRERQYDRLAEHLRANLDLEYILSNLRKI
jgi:adenosylcobyric acid synthase